MYINPQPATRLQYLPLLYGLWRWATGPDKLPPPDQSITLFFRRLPVILEGKLYVQICYGHLPHLGFNYSTVIFLQSSQDSKALVTQPESQDPTQVSLFLLRRLLRLLARGCVNVYTGAVDYFSPPSRTGCEQAQTHFPAPNPE